MHDAHGNTLIITVLSTLMTLASAGADTTFYVDDDAQPGGDGTSWATAMRYLQDALAAVGEGDTIRIAGGSYTPDRDEAGQVTPGDLEATFLIPDDTRVYGGYQGCPGGDCSQDPDLRDVLRFQTVLTGDLNGDDRPHDPWPLGNSYHIVTVHDTDKTVLLDGCVITGGDAISEVEPGAAIHCVHGNMEIHRCAITRNLSGDNLGTMTGACLFVDSTAAFMNCILADNAERSSGGISIYGSQGSTIRATNCTFMDDVLRSPHNDPAHIGCTDSSVYLANSLLWGTTDDTHPLSMIALWGESALADIRHCNIGGGQGNIIGSADATLVWDTSNIDQDPKFLHAVPVGHFDYELQGDSPCIDAGGDTHVMPDTTVDIAGHPRVVDDPVADDTGEPVPSVVDIGAFEYQQDCNGNGLPDSLDVASQTSPDCNNNAIPDECEPPGDCNDNGILDTCDLVNQASTDCNANGIPDECDVATPMWPDADSNGVLDVCQATRLYVSQHAAGAQTGLDWANPMHELRDALRLVHETDAPITEIWVAQGTYAPDGPGGSPEASFELAGNLALYGGFEGGETALDQRDWNQHVTTLTGDLNGDDGPGFEHNSENSYHVVTAVDVPSSAVLSGFHITGGNANMWYPHRDGAGVHLANASPAITHCTISNNSAGFAGGGIFVDQGYPTFRRCVMANNTSQRGGGIRAQASHIALEDCLISGNHAEDGGGGVSIEDCVATVILCHIVGNTIDQSGWVYFNRGAGVCISGGDVAVCDSTISENSGGNGGGGGISMHGGQSTVMTCTVSRNMTLGDGGGIAGHGGRLRVVNCAITANTASQQGGGICGYAYSRITCTNCSLTANEATTGPAVATYGPRSSGQSRTTLTNCIVVGPEESIATGPYGTTTVQYSNIPGNGPGVGNIHTDPAFVDPAGPDGVIGTGDDNLRLLPGSPCIDAGNSDADIDAYLVEQQSIPPLDLDLFARFVEHPASPDVGYASGSMPYVDMGAYEFRPGDCANDGAVDANDFAALVGCLTGPAISASPGCPCFDANANGHIDLLDWAAVQNAWTGP